MPSKRYEHLGPGLHKVGPAPYDYVFNPAEGMKVSAVLTNGQIVTGIVTDVAENKETGEICLRAEEHPDPQYVYTCSDDD